MTALEALNLAAPIADAYMSVEERLLVRIARQLSLNDDHQLNEVSKWQIKQLAKHGLLRQDAHKIIAAGTKGIPGNVAETVRQAIDDTLAEDDIQDMWHNQQFAESAANAMKHYRNQAKDVYNQVNTVMKYKAESTFVRAVNSVADKWTQEQRRAQSEIANKQDVLNILNSNTAAVVSGAESRTKAVRTTIHEMAEKGIPAFVDKSGREWSPEAYVNMDIRATVKNTALEAQFSTMDSLGQDVFEVSSHPGSRPKCRPWQGKLISRSGRTTEITDINGRKHKVIPLSQTSFGEPDGLFGINCGHRPRGVSDGLFRKSSVEYDDEEDKELYNKVCKQRELERRVRKSKTEADMLEAAGDTEGAKEVRRKMTEQNKALKSYCDSNGLKYRSDRVRTYGSVKPDTDSARRKAMAAEMNKSQTSHVPQTVSAVSSFVPAKTVQEAQEYAQKLGVKYADYSKFTIERANNLNMAISTLPDDSAPVLVTDLQKYTKVTGAPLGRAQNNAYAVTVAPYEINPSAVGANAPLIEASGESVVAVNTRSFKSIDSLTKTKQEVNEKYVQRYGHGWHFNTDGAVTDFHECGHVYQNKYGLPTAFGADAARWQRETGLGILKSTNEAWAEAYGAYYTHREDLPDYIRRYFDPGEWKESSGSKVLSFDEWQKKLGNALDKSGGSGIIKARQLAQKKTFNYRDFDEVVDEKSVSELKQYAAEKMGINHISGIDKLKNGRQAHELLSKVEELSEQYGKRFTRVSLFDYGDERTAAETVGNELRLNVQYLNRPGALQAVLDEWNESGHIPKGCNNVAYVAKHEYSHLLTQDIIDMPKSKILTEIRRQNVPPISMNATNDTHEYVADLLSAIKLSPKQKKLKETIISIVMKG